MTTQQKKKGRGPRALWTSERGGVAMYLGLSMMFIMPIMAGAISVSQVHTLNTELQPAADAAALAAAKELNGSQAGCDAAKLAAVNAVRNFQSFANDDYGAEARPEAKIMMILDQDDEISPVMFLSRLPEAPLSDFERLGVTGRYAALEVAENK